MIKNVLLVDDDHEMLIALKEGFQKYKDSFSILMAADGLKAVEGLKTSTISLVVPECSDGIDNDDDGYVDMEDPGRFCPEYPLRLLDKLLSRMQGFL